MKNSIVIPLNIAGVNVVGQSTDENGNPIIHVESAQEGCECPSCNRTIYHFHGYRNERIFRHTSIFGMKSYVKVRLKRFKCPYCDESPTVTQPLTFCHERSQFTIDYENHVLLQMINSTVSDVAIKEELTQDEVEGILDRHIEVGVKWDYFEKIEVIGVDDFTIRKGGKERVAIVSTRDEQGNLSVLGVLKDHKKKTVKEFFMSIPKRLRRTVKYVCSDLYEGFLNAAREVFGQRVKVVADRFHVAKLYREGLDNLRKNEMKRLEKELADNEVKIVRKSSYLLRKSELNDEEEKQLEKVFRHSPMLKKAWELSNELTAIFNSHLSSREARTKIRAWKKQVKKSGVDCFNKFIGTLTKYERYILGYFDGRHSSGFVEGLNNKIRVLRRRCYGLFNLERWFQRLIIDLEGYKRFRKNL